jgi:hypothetical protein
MNNDQSRGREKKLDRVVPRCITIYRSQDEALKAANINLSGKIQWFLDTFVLPTEINEKFMPNAERIFISETEGIKDYLRKFGEEKTIAYVRKIIDDKMGIPVTMKQAENFWIKWKHLVA